jgi:hypothetical protein
MAAFFFRATFASDVDLANEELWLGANLAYDAGDTLNRHTRNLQASLYPLRRDPPSSLSSDR